MIEFIQLTSWHWLNCKDTTVNQGACWTRCNSKRIKHKMLYLETNKNPSTVATGPKILRKYSYSGLYVTILGDVTNILQRKIFQKPISACPISQAPGSQTTSTWCGWRDTPRLSTCSYCLQLTFVLADMRKLFYVFFHPENLEILFQTSHVCKILIP